MSLEKVKIALLAHSKNMLNAAQAEDWLWFSELDSVWQSQIQSAVQTYGSDLNSIGSQLLSDNQGIQNCIKQGQQKLANELQKKSQSHSFVKQYLK